MSAEANSLEAGLVALGLTAPAQAIDRLVRYLDLLEKWNATYNLTSVRDRRSWVSVHLLDSLAATPYVVGDRIVDVGTGAGLPGIPLAICRPEWKVLMIDSVQKKTAFIAQVIAELGLSNATVRHGRVEDIRLDVLANTAISRAFSDLGKFVRLVHPLVRADGEILAMKGSHPAAELPRVPGDYELVSMPRIHVPGLDADRHLALFRRRPEKAGMTS
ncbi:MAG: 16S rRNA (guanine(527)-N(7))-methyltransferase RsmG [Burkholderiales bacterium]